MENDEKTCPRCAETVKAAAVVCKHCGYDFNTNAQLAAAAPIKTVQPTKKSSAIKIGCLSVIGIVVVLGIIGALTGPSNKGGTSESTDPSQSATAVAVTSVELAEAYHENEVAAQNRYGNKTLDVTGDVTGVTLDFMNNPTLQMRGVNEFLPLQATFDKSYSEKLGAISKGMQVTIRCTQITEVVSAPMLKDCSIP